MKTTILFLSVLLTTSSFSVAQQKTEKFNKEKLIIELNYGRGSTKTFFKSTHITQKDHSSNAKPSYSLAISGKLYKCLYLKTELGYTQIEELIEAKFKDDSNYVRNLYNWYEAGYVSFSILPELRLVNDYAGFYINSGVGFYSTTSTRFFSGIYNDFNAAEFRSSNFAWVSNAAIRFTYKGIGIHAGAGFNYVAPQKKDKFGRPYDFGLGFKQSVIRFGINYNIK